MNCTPFPDIDILILSNNKLPNALEAKISEFITLLWDLRLEVGHAVRTVEECAEIGRSDLTVATNLQEARLLCGSEDTFQALKKVVLSDSFYQARPFIEPKFKNSANAMLGTMTRPTILNQTSNPHQVVYVTFIH